MADSPAILALASGEIFTGKGFGHPGPVCGEVVFNTSLTGYQEIITDPSYRGQLVCMTAPHIGIVGVNDLDEEAGGPQVAALIVRSLSQTTSNWRAQGSLAQTSGERNLTGISELDTRTLTQLLRTKGAVNGCVMHGDDTEEALAQARACPPMVGNALGAEVGTAESYAWSQSVWQDDTNEFLESQDNGPKVAVLDCGVKRAILRELAHRGLSVTVVPYGVDADELLSSYQGVVLSNGPGDPEPLAEAVALAEKLLAADMPVLGICLGHQILSQAAGAKVVKMKFGHHGANHPVQDLRDNRVLITSQNHGFAVERESMPADLQITHVSLFDGTVQGFVHAEKPALAFQGHPEASPGPREMAELFDSFAAMVQTNAQSA